MWIGIPNILGSVNDPLPFYFNNSVQGFIFVNAIPFNHLRKLNSEKMGITGFFFSKWPDLVAMVTENNHRRYYFNS